MGHVNIKILILQKNFYDRAIIEASMQKCNVLKLNDEVLEAELEWHKDQSPVGHPFSSQMRWQMGHRNQILFIRSLMRGFHD